MTRRNALMVAAAVLISVVAILIGWNLGRDRRGSGQIDEVDVPQQQVMEGETTVAELFFPGPGGRLFVEEREVPTQETFRAHLLQIVDELLAGPTSVDLFPALPPGFTLGWLHLNSAGVLYVDFKLSSDDPLPAWGSRQEMLAVYGVVNTLLATTPRIKSVVLLRNGQQRPTFAGHLDTSRPLLANQELVATLEPRN